MLGANGAPEVSLLRSWNRMNTISYRTITTIVYSGQITCRWLFLVLTHYACLVDKETGSFLKH